MIITLCNNKNFLISQSHINKDINTNLIVNYLPQNLTSVELKTIFETLGPLESCNLVIDKVTKQSHCYGFVNYLNLAHAEEAVRKMNGFRIGNKTIKVSHARPSSESIQGANLYICGIPKTWTNNDMNKYLGSCGKIITSRILYNSLNGQSKGVGFIRFDQKYQANLALNTLNNSIPDGCLEPIIIKFANTPSEIKIASQNINFRGYSLESPVQYLNTNDGVYKNVSLETINPNINEAQLPYVTKYAMYSYDPYAGGDGAGILLQPQQNIEQPLLKPIPTNPSNGWSIFVYNLANDTEENTLWELFGPFGAVLNVKIIRDYQTLKCKGFGFVTMNSYENSINAISSLNGIELGDRTLQVSFKTTLKI